MSLERILKVLAALGLTRNDAEVYLLVATKGPIEVKEIVATLCSGRKQFQMTLEKLANRGLIKFTSKPSVCLTAVDFAEVLDSYLRSRKDAIQDLEQNRISILSEWKSIVTDNL